MKLITEVLEDSLEYITEANEEGEKEYFIEGIFMQANKPNRNGRIYPTSILEHEVKRYNKEYVMKNRAFGELGHPQGPTINLERVSHMIKELYQDGDNFVGRAKIMDSPYGSIVKNLIKEGASLGVSSRGMGSLKTKNGVNEVQKDFYLATAADIVADPSAPDAFVEGIMEGVDWVMNGGKWVQTFVEKSQYEIKRTRKAELETTKLRIFEDFLKKI
jgi:hypothetical protein|tara:strand:- start:1108 stop:1758 length:651 start_codon:yes stop_codon:yes gene_type:complete